MKKNPFAFGGMVGDREAGAPIDFARTRGELEDRLASTGIMLALTDEAEEVDGIDPYNSAGTVC